MVITKLCYIIGEHFLLTVMCRPHIYIYNLYLLCSDLGISKSDMHIYVPYLTVKHIIVMYAVAISLVTSLNCLVTISTWSMQYMFSSIIVLQTSIITERKLLGTVNV